MAMGSRSRREIESAIACCRPFKNSTGSMTGTRGSTRTLGWLEQHADARRIKALLSRATYVVWSYNTPIGFVAEDEAGDIEKFYVEAQHTVTTSHHQGVLKVAWGEYETIGEERRRRSPARREPRPTRVPAPAPARSFTSNDAMVADYSFAAQDDLMDEVRAYSHPSHP